MGLRLVSSHLFTLFTVNIILMMTIVQNQEHLKGTIKYQGVHLLGYVCLIGIIWYIESALASFSFLTLDNSLKFFQLLQLD